MCSAWSRSLEPAGSIVMNGMSVRSRSGSRGFAAASCAAATTSGGKSTVTSSSPWIRLIRSCSSAQPSRTRRTRLLTLPPRSSGVAPMTATTLYDALDVASGDPAARRRATRWLVIMSSLFGAVRPNDPIPSYRLSGGTNLPGPGEVASHWRTQLGPVLSEAAGSGLVVDLRSSSYASFWRPDRALAARVATVRVLHQVGDRRTVVSHFNKATKGRLVRALLDDGSPPSG